MKNHNLIIQMKIIVIHIHILNHILIQMNQRSNQLRKLIKNMKIQNQVKFKQRIRRRNYKNKNLHIVIHHIHLMNILIQNLQNKIRNNKNNKNLLHLHKLENKLIK